MPLSFYNTHMDLKEIETTALAIARETGELLRHGFQQTKQVEFKSSAIDLVTEYDTEAEALISRELARTFPSHQVFAEESTLEGGENEPLPGVEDDTYTWYIDPIDGTGNFAHGFPHFVTSLALYRGSRPLVGVVYDPMRDEYFHATSGGGASLTPADGASRPLTVSTAEQLLHSLLVTGFPYDRHDSVLDNVAQFAAFLKKARGLRRTGAAALDLAYIAAGRLDGYWEYKLNSWDVAAGVLLVTEAGGQVTATDGSSFTLTRKVDLIASNGHIHQAMVDVLSGLDSHR